MVDARVLVSVVDPYPTPHQVAVDNLNVLLSEAVSLTILHKLQDSLDVLILRADRVAEDLGSWRTARNSEGESWILDTQGSLDDVLHLGTVGCHAGPGLDLLRPLPLFKICV